MYVKQLEELVEALEHPLLTPEVSYKFVKKDLYNWYMFFSSPNNNCPQLEREIDKMLFGFNSHEALDIKRSTVQGETRLEFIISRKELKRLSFKFCDRFLVSALIRWGNRYV